MTYVVRREPVRRSFTARAALWLSAFGLLVALYSGALIRTQSVEALSAVAAFASGLALAGVGALVGLVALVVVWRSGAKGGGRATLAIIVAALVIVLPAYVEGVRLDRPAINDVSTDLSDPPRLDRARLDRGLGDNPPPPAAIPQAQGEAQRGAYPELQPLRLSLPANDVTNLALGLVEDRGWTVVGRTAFPRGGPPTGRIEAVARTRLLGLRDDVSIRIRPDGDGARVDMRSASRIGRADFGVNAERIRSFLADLAAGANAAP